MNMKLNESKAMGSAARGDLKISRKTADVMKIRDDRGERGNLDSLF